MFTVLGTKGKSLFNSKFSTEAILEAWRPVIASYRGEGCYYLLVVEVTDTAQHLQREGQTLAQMEFISPKWQLYQG